ncbi:GNAT family N-acetyltransferase, partial [Thiococcus pfennigii]|nr:GNAT family N-acetyltransferase [Thiococcus pfennigii]
TAAGRALLTEAARRLAERLPRLLPGPLRQVAPATIAALLATLPARTPRLTAGERRELAAFAHARRALEPTLPLLAELASARLGAALRQRRIGSELAALVVAVVLQLRPPAEASAETAAHGRADLIAQLRQASALLLTG